MCLLSSSLFWGGGEGGSIFLYISIHGHLGRYVLVSGFFVALRNTSRPTNKNESGITTCLLST